MVEQVNMKRGKRITWWMAVRLSLRLKQELALAGSIRKSGTHSLLCNQSSRWSIGRAGIALRC